MPAPSSSSSKTPVDPWRAVMRLGRRTSAVGVWGGLLLAMLSHGAALAKPAMELYDMRDGVKSMREELVSYFWSSYEIDVIDDKPEPEPEPEVEPEPEPEPEVEPEPVDPTEPPPELETVDPTDPPPEGDPYQDDSPAPAAAEAADVLTASDDAVDLTGENTFVDKDGSIARGGGYTAGDGKGKGLVKDPKATTKGTPGGTGTATSKPRPRPRPTKDLSRGPQLLSKGAIAACGRSFPAQANLGQVDRAVVTVAVTVGPNGSVISSRPVSDPGYGFGPLAARCASRAKFKPALDRSGRPKTGTATFRIRFSR